jgi:hypothetical protein
MSRYYFHLRQGADLYEDAEGVELRDFSAAREEALNGEAMRFSLDLKTEALIIADEDGQQLAIIPITAALPPIILERVVLKSANVETGSAKAC